jgi:hypothetical protein
MSNLTFSTSDDNAATERFDADECRRALDILHDPGTVFEIRIPKTARHGVVSGYFDDPQKAVRAVATLSGRVPGIYTTSNPVNPDLLARTDNHLTNRSKRTTSDRDILRRRLLLIDLDPIRPAGISSTDREHAAALTLAEEIREWLTAQGWPEPILADSGNGAHLLARIDQPNDDNARGLVERCLKALSWKFTDEVVEVDLTTFNAARIWKLYGTMACKGDSTEERPHRLARILKVPERTEVMA